MDELAKKFARRYRSWIDGIELDKSKANAVWAAVSRILELNQVRPALRLFGQIRSRWADDTLARGREGEKKYENKC